MAKKNNKQSVTKVYTTGVYDIMHEGHINTLTTAKSLGNYLIVGIQDDEGVRASKGTYPVRPASERIMQIQALPFVDEVFIYEGAEQRPHLERIRPHIMAQGEDWHKTGDRSAIVEFLNTNSIQLVLIPFVPGISSSEIKRRVLHQSERNDKDFLLHNVKLVSIPDLKLYEEYDKKKVAKLVKKIEKEKVFFNPITVNEHLVVIDGVNRLEALKRLKAKFIPCLVVQYKDVELAQNIHYKKGNEVTRLSEFGAGEGEKVVFPLYSKEDILQIADSGEKVPNGATWHKVRTAVVRLKVPLKDLQKGFDFDAFLRKTIKEGNIRYYPANVYICDEWE
jgi:glycerol-3-phosphate cytidylyltransferase